MSGFFDSIFRGFIDDGGFGFSQSQGCDVTKNNDDGSNIDCRGSEFGDFCKREGPFNEGKCQPNTGLMVCGSYGVTTCTKGFECISNVCKSVGKKCGNPTDCEIFGEYCITLEDGSKECGSCSDHLPNAVNDRISKLDDLCVEHGLNFCNIIDGICQDSRLGFNCFGKDDVWCNDGAVYGLICDSKDNICKYPNQEFIEPEVAGCINNDHCISFFNKDYVCYKDVDKKTYNVELEGGCSPCVNHKACEGGRIFIDEDLFEVSRHPAGNKCYPVDGTCQDDYENFECGPHCRFRNEEGCVVYCGSGLNCNYNKCEINPYGVRCNSYGRCYEGVCVDIMTDIGIEQFCRSCSSNSQCEETSEIGPICFSGNCQEGKEGDPCTHNGHCVGFSLDYLVPIRCNTVKGECEPIYNI